MNTTAKKRTLMGSWHDERPHRQPSSDGHASETLASAGNQRAEIVANSKSQKRNEHMEQARMRATETRKASQNMSKHRNAPH